VASVPFVVSCDATVEAGRINCGIRRAEHTASATKLTRVNDQAIRRVLEAAGVEFIDANGGGPGVRLRARSTAGQQS